MYIAIAAVFLGHRDEVAAYTKYAQIDPSRGRTAQADFAVSEGRLHDAARILEVGVAEDNENKRIDAAEVKHAMLAEVKLRRGDSKGAHFIRHQNFNNSATSQSASGIVGP